MSLVNINKNGIDNTRNNHDKGGYPNEIKTKIRYVIIILIYENMITTSN